MKYGSLTYIRIKFNYKLLQCQRDNVFPLVWHLVYRSVTITYKKFRDVLVALKIGSEE